ncbi:MAG: hypothetical protein ACHQSE_01185 [Gemmatimonadales bacterium]
MSRKTTFAVAALLSFAVAGAAMAQGTKTDSTKKAPAKSTMMKKSTKTAKADTGAKKASKGMKKGGAMKKDSTAKKP